MRIPSGVTDQYIYFVAVDGTDLVTRETGLSGFTVYRSRNGGAAAAFTTPTVNEVDATNMPGVYELLLDEDMSIDSGDDSQEMVFHITHASMAPVTRVIELYRREVTAGQTVDVSNGGVEVGSFQADAITAAAIAADAGTEIATAVWAAAARTLTALDEDSVTLDLDATIRAALGMSAANLDTQLSTIDTVVDSILVDTAEIGAAGAGLSAIPWNASWDAEVQSEVTDALNAYDPPTNAEMEARTLAAADYATATALATVDTVVDAILVDTDSTIPGTLSTIAGYIDTEIATIDTVVDAIQVVTDTLAPIRTGTAQAGAAGTITLDASASSVTDFYEGCIIRLTGGTGAGQIGMCAAYNGTTKVATMARNWKTTPDNTTTFAVIPFGLADLSSILGTAVSTSSAQLGVNVIQAAGTAWGSGAITAGAIAADAIGASELAADAASEIATAVWAAAARTLTALDEDSTTLDLDATIRAAVGLASANLDTQIGTLATASNLATVAGYLDTEIAAILADTNELQTDWVDGGRLDLLLDAVKAKTDNLPSDPADASVVAGLIAAAEAKIDTVDTVVDAIKSKTDSLTFTVAGEIDANVVSVNDVEVVGDGSEGTPWGPAP